MQKYSIGDFILIHPWGCDDNKLTNLLAEILSEVTNEAVKVNYVLPAQYKHFTEFLPLTTINSLLIRHYKNEAQHDL